MHIPTIYKENIESHQEYVDLSDDKLHHLIKVLRIANNSPVKISTGEGTLYIGTMEKNKIKITSKETHERNNKVNIFIPVMKNKDRFRFMIEKLTELNTNSITIGKTEYSQKVNIKKEKINSWVISSIEQSGTPFIPKIDIVERLDFNFFNHALDIKGKEISTNINQKNIAIGPEGGWSEAELSKFSYTSNINEFTFRTETAAIVAVSLMV